MLGKHFVSFCRLSRLKPLAQLSTRDAGMISSSGPFAKCRSCVERKYSGTVASIVELRGNDVR